MVFPNALSDEVPKVPEALRAPFWHFCHPVSLRIWRNHTSSSVPHYARETFFTLPLGYAKDVCTSINHRYISRIHL